MKFSTPGLSNFSLGILLSATLLPVVWSVPVQAAFLPNLSGSEMSTYTAYPVTTLEAVTPKVLLAMSRDHNYFFKAYNDYTDLDGDGVIETTYDNDFEYYGYFDPDKCYSYILDRPGAGTSGDIYYFEPRAFTNDHYCDAVNGEWSGNFLNWGTMTRMDIIRKIVYGGRRWEDKETHTVLERAFLPPDAHAFAKYYNGDDIPKLTPFTTSDFTPTDGDGIDEEEEGITLCNLTYAESGTSQNTNARPLMRIVRGNYSLWAAGEVLQCHFSDDPAVGGRQIRDAGFGVNNNVSAKSGINAYANSPPQSERLVASVGDEDPTFGWNVHVNTCVVAPEYCNADGVACDPESDGDACNKCPVLFLASGGNEHCRSYPNGNFKPSGLFQEYGEDQKIHFGAFTGTYEKNKSGGVLRKHIGPLDDEIRVDTDGTFKADPNSATPAVGVVRALDIFKIHGYDLAIDKKGEEGTRYPDCEGESFEEGTCASWGNAVSEMYAEAIRYFAGLSPTTSFQANDNSYIGGLKEDEWKPVLNDDNFCAGLNIVMINSSVISFDQETSHFSTLPGSPDPQTLTKAVGTAEGLNQKSWFVGERLGQSNTYDGYCTPKIVSDLGNVSGVCPEAPTLDGTYRMSGMAWWARTHDLLDGLQGTQSVTSYMVQLATNNPIIKIDCPAWAAAAGEDVNEACDDETAPANAFDGEIQLLPAYRRLDDNSAGTLSDFRIVQPLYETTGSETDVAYKGKAFAQWDEREQGGDFDQDIWGTIDYELFYKNNAWRLKVTTDAIAATAYSRQLFGFILSGTQVTFDGNTYTSDGFHAFSGAYREEGEDAGETGSNLDSSGDGVVFKDPLNIFGIPDCQSKCFVDDGPVSFTFTATSGSRSRTLPDPLYLAAKWGGFDDNNDNDIPDQPNEWDIRDASGRKGNPDGNPDTYYFVNNPSALEESLRAVFNQIIERVASGTAAAVVASEQEGTGAVYQALYDPVKTDPDGREAAWIGTLHALFIDPKGFLREDSDNDATLDGYDVDPVIEIYFDEEERRSRLRRYGSSTSSVFTQSGDPIAGELETLEPIWNARTQLASLADSDLLSQRGWGTAAGSGRYITTWLDSDLDGIVDPDEQVDFTAATFTLDNFGWLDVYSLDSGGSYTTDETHKLVNYIRGVDQEGYRSRQLDYNKNRTVQTMRLGDIVDSTPTVQGAPAESFDILSLDISYNEFRRQYRNRRNVVYVGANDGMIHAFNGGFFDVESLSFKTQLTDETAHPLGSEIWAYIPKNLLGHLQWLADEDYSHVFYADLKPLLFDARVFPDDDTHPNGWGTILVVGMRLGGGQDSTGITLHTSAENEVGANDDDVATKSAYVLLDVTDPERPPELIAELSPPTLQFTTSYPSVMAISHPQTFCDLYSEKEECDDYESNPNRPNKWYLLFGSGPTNLGTVESTQTARVFAYDLNLLVASESRDAALVTTGPFSGGYADTGEANSFVGEFTTADQNFNMKAEAVYFGTVGSDDGTGGNIYRMTVPNDETALALYSPDYWGNVFKLLAVNRPFVARPSITLDKSGKTWILAGSGRQFTNGDKISTTTQSLYGFIDPNEFKLDPSLYQVTADSSSFIDVTDAITYTNGSVDLDGDGTIDSTIEEATADVAAQGGWRLDYASSGVDPAERTLSNQTLIGGIVLSSAFTPATTQCGGEGTSRLLGRAFNSGLVPPRGIFGTEPCGGSCPDETVEAIAIGSEYLGSGLASSPSIHIGNQEVPGKVTVIVQQSTGAITGNQAQTITGISNGEVSWQEYRSE